MILKADAAGKRGKDREDLLSEDAPESGYESLIVCDGERRMMRMIAIDHDPLKPLPADHRGSGIRGKDWWE